MGPNYANLFVGYVEEQIFNQFDGPKPELFGRYIDDCLGATSCTKEELTLYCNFDRLVLTMQLKYFIAFGPLGCHFNFNNIFIGNNVLLICCVFICCSFPQKCISH